MSLGTIMAEDRRAAILATLAETNGYSVNEATLKLVLDRLGHRVTQDQLRGDLNWLAQQGLVRNEVEHVTSGDLWIVHLLASGQDVANGAVFPGIARPRAH